MTWSPKCLLFSLTIALLGCPHRPSPSRAIPYVPPPIYDEWWQKMVSCSGVVPPVAMTRVNFFIVLAPYFLVNGDTVVGLSGKDTRTGERYIYLVSDLLLDERSVEHEMLHTILDNRPGHPYTPGTFPCRVWTPEGYVLHDGDN